MTAWNVPIGSTSGRRRCRGLTLRLPARLWPCNEILGRSCENAAGEDGLKSGRQRRCSLRAAMCSHSTFHLIRPGSSPTPGIGIAGTVCRRLIEPAQVDVARIAPAWPIMYMPMRRLCRSPGHCCPHWRGRRRLRRLRRPPALPVRTRSGRCCHRGAVWSGCRPDLPARTGSHRSTSWCADSIA